MAHFLFTKTPDVWEAPLLGRIEGCTNPESAELLPDGKTFVFGNCTMMVGHPAYRSGQGIVYLKNEAFVSRAVIGDDRTVSLDQRVLIPGLTATLGCDVLKRATARLPVGTVLMAEGGRPITVAGSPALQADGEARPRAIAFDPATGRLLGAVGLDADSPIGRRFNPIDQPNGLALDVHGNRSPSE